MRKILCWVFGHRDLRITGVDVKTGAERWVCRRCLRTWVEFNITGVHR